MSNIFLTPSEIQQLTMKTRREQQAEALMYMGIVFKERPDGSLAILKAHIHQVFGVTVEQLLEEQKEIEPTWENI